MGLMTESELVGGGERIHGQGCCGLVPVHFPQNSADLQPATVVVGLLVDRLDIRGSQEPKLLAAADVRCL